jgi:hypothetical protein
MGYIKTKIKDYVLIKENYTIPFSNEKSFINYNKVLIYSYFLNGGDTIGDINQSKLKADRFEEDGMIEDTLNFIDINNEVIKIAMDECYNIIKNETNESFKIIPNKDNIIRLWSEHLHNPSNYMIAIYSMRKFCQFLLTQISTNLSV